MTESRKSPQEKKRLSLEKDCRNDYGENDKASRKNIPRSKAMSHRKVRRKSKQLETVWESLDENEAVVLESTATSRALQKPAWKKSSDTPLKEFLVQQRKKGQAREGRKKIAAHTRAASAPAKPAE